MKTIVGLYKTMAEANKVKSALTSEGYEAKDISVIDQTGSGSTDTGYKTTDTSHESVGTRIKNFFSGVSGTDEAAHRSYTEGVANGGALVAVTVDDADAEETADLLHQHGASDIEGGYGDAYGSGAGGYGTGRNTGAGAEDVAVLQGNNANTGRNTGEQVIPVVAEELEVGKRTVQRGGVRIYSRVVSEPVSESINLHDERVVVDRHAVDRPATDADFKTGEGVVEVRASGEEAVVGKRSRVVEEVMVGKQASDRTEQINDSVRHTEVDVEQTEGEVAGAARGTKTGNTGSGRL